MSTGPEPAERAHELNIRAGLRLGILGGVPALATFGAYLARNSDPGGLVAGAVAIPFAVITCLTLEAVYWPLIQALRAQGFTTARISAEIARWSPLWLGVASPLSLGTMGLPVMVAGVSGLWLALASRLAWLRRNAVLDGAARAEDHEFILSAQWVLRWDLFTATCALALLIMALGLAQNVSDGEMNSMAFLLAVFSLIPLYGSAINAEERDPALTHRQRQWARLSFALLAPPLFLQVRIDQPGALIVSIACLVIFVAVRESYRREGRRLHSGTRSDAPRILEIAQFAGTSRPASSIAGGAASP